MNSELTKEKLLEHVWHDIVIVRYGDPDTNDWWNVALECESCNVVLADADAAEETSKSYKRE